MLHRLGPVRDRIRLIARLSKLFPCSGARALVCAEMAREHLGTLPGQLRYALEDWRRLVSETGDVLPGRLDEARAAMQAISEATSACEDGSAFLRQVASRREVEPLLSMACVLSTCKEEDEGAWRLVAEGVRDAVMTLPELRVALDLIQSGPNYTPPAACPTSMPECGALVELWHVSQPSHQGAPSLGDADLMDCVVQGASDGPTSTTPEPLPFPLSNGDGDEAIVVAENDAGLSPDGAQSSPMGQGLLRAMRDKYDERPAVRIGSLSSASSTPGLAEAASIRDQLHRFLTSRLGRSDRMSFTTSSGNHLDASQGLATTRLFFASDTSAGHGAQAVDTIDAGGVTLQALEMLAAELSSTLFENKQGSVLDFPRVPADPLGKSHHHLLLGYILGQTPVQFGRFVCAPCPADLIILLCLTEEDKIPEALFAGFASFVLGRLAENGACELAWNALRSGSEGGLGDARDEFSRMLDAWQHSPDLVGQLQHSALAPLATLATATQDVREGFLSGVFDDAAQWLDSWETEGVILNAWQVFAGEVLRRLVLKRSYERIGSGLLQSGFTRAAVDLLVSSKPSLPGLRDQVLRELVEPQRPKEVTAEEVIGKLVLREAPGSASDVQVRRRQARFAALKRSLPQLTAQELRLLIRAVTG